MRGLVLIGGAVAALAVAGSAGATIVPQKSIAGITFKSTQAQVKALVGMPTSTKHGSNDFGPYTTFYYKGLQITFQGNTTVTNIVTTRASEKTSSGVGVGSTKAQLLAGVKGLKCEQMHCYIGAFLAGRTVTDFTLSAAGRVTRVDLGIVID